MVARLYRDVQCGIDDCDRDAYVRGWCEPHYSRWKKHGDPLAGSPTRAVLSADELRCRLARGIGQIHNPLALARKYLAGRNLLGGRDEDDLMDVAVDAVVDAAIAWDPNGGRSITSWAYLYMDRNVNRELIRCNRRRSEIDAYQCNGGDVADWLLYDPGTDPYAQVELRTDLQRWADLAELTPLMRFIVEYAAIHKGTYVRDTPYAGAPTPLSGSGSTTLKLALKHMRRAAVTGERRDDKWTRMRDRQFFEDRSNRLLAELRAVETEREQVA